MTIGPAVFEGLNNTNMGPSTSGRKGPLDRAILSRSSVKSTTFVPSAARCSGKTYGRVVDPLLNILRFDDHWDRQSLVQSGISLETLDYLIDVEKNDGASLSGRKQTYFKYGLRIILADMKVNPL